MRTPYDAAIRVSRQVLDDVRIEVVAKADEVDGLKRAREGVDAELIAEADLIREDYLPCFNYGAFAQRKREEAARIDAAASDARSQLAALEERAQEAFGDYKSLDVAAERYTETVRAEARRREQTVMDELAMNATRKAKAA